MLQKSSIMLTLEAFFHHPTMELTLKDISGLSKLAHTSTKQNLKKLIKLGLVQQRKQKKGKRTFPLYQAARNKYFIQYKKISNLAALTESGVIQHIDEIVMPKCIVVFGSYQRGEDTEESDIDLFIEGKNEDVKLKNFAKKLMRNIELHFNEEFKSYPIELKNNIVNGTVIHGFLEAYS